MERRSLDQMRVRCLILEAQKDAEKLLSSRYGGILAELMGETDISAVTANGPESSGLRLMPSDGSARSASQVAQPAATITECPIEVPYPATSTRSRTSPPNSRPVRVSRNKQRSSAQTTIRVPPGCLPSPGGTVDDTSLTLTEILTRAGVMPFELTRDEMIRARETRAIPRHTFSKNFGGTWKSEWPGCTRIPGYKNFLCVDINAQPFAPTAPGKPGLIFRFPTTVPTPLDDGDTFHLFLVRGGLLHYQGDYVRPRLRVEVEFNHWNDLSHDCRHIWLKRMTNNHASGNLCRALRARIILRNKLKREPHSTEVLKYVTSGSDHTLSYTAVSAAFRAGEEKILCEAIQCIGYDSNLATIMQRLA